MWKSNFHQLTINQVNRFNFCALLMSNKLIDYHFSDVQFPEHGYEAFKDKLLQEDNLSSTPMENLESISQQNTSI